MPEAVQTIITRVADGTLSAAAYFNSMLGALYQLNRASNFQLPPGDRYDLVVGYRWGR